MNLLHTSDWHIGQVLNFHYDRQEEHQHFLDQLCCIIECEHPDALIVSGDLYDIADDYDYFALGHIHTPQTLSNGKARYCGSPVQLNFKEQFPHSVTMVTLENHGDMPTIETIELEPLRKYYIIPSKPTPLEDALAYLGNNLPDSQGYVQVNILSAERLPSDTENRIRNILAKGENLLYCDHKCTRPAIEGGNTIEKPDFNLTEFKEKSPLEIAEHYVRDSNGAEMDDTLKELLFTVIQEVKKEAAR